METITVTAIKTTTVTVIATATSTADAAWYKIPSSALSEVFTWIGWITYYTFFFLIGIMVHCSYAFWAAYFLQFRSPALSRRAVRTRIAGALLISLSMHILLLGPFSTPSFPFGCQPYFSRVTSYCFSIWLAMACLEGAVAACQMLSEHILTNAEKSLGAKYGGSQDQTQSLEEAGDGAGTSSGQPSRTG